MSMTIITPYVYEEEIQPIRELASFSECEWLMSRDDARIGSDLMYQKMWKRVDNDIFIWHADMRPHPDYPDWQEQIMSYAKKYPEAGMIGTLLLYPMNSSEGTQIVQSAGGRFENRVPRHFTGFSSQYQQIREVPWTTFGGVYLRREMLNDVGDFDASYEWSYNRDVDYCLQARQKGWKIYQVPTQIYHDESRDNARLKPERFVIEARNLQRLQEKWGEKLDDTFEYPIT